MMMWKPSGQSEVVVCGEIEPDMMSSADSLYPPFLLLLSFYLPHLATFILSSAFSSSIQTQSQLLTSSSNLKNEQKLYKKWIHDSFDIFPLV